MAMSKTALGKAIADLIIDANAPADMKAKITSQWTNIAGAIIDEIKKSTITVAAGIPVSTAGSPTAQTGATTSTGTATIM
jgi:predicted KAP-like P-loop ATPase